ncbi:MAG: succinate dehydrogenase/fumarate reductase iron-sulfur subunit [Propionibacteriaceae bacterium]|nr:succinate dehydrogenase/fumarate reductase iron-sulfur subunit [Propionibacteriaceae bacterium]
MKITLKIWRQANKDAVGGMKTYQLDDVSEDMSFLEMLDVLNEHLTLANEEPVAFDYDCREGICGMCGVVINGAPHGRYNSPIPTTTCQLHMRCFKDGDVIEIEPWKTGSFPVVKDLVVDRSAFDRIIQAGGFISVNTGSAPEAHSVPAPKRQADRAFDVATCIGCGACVAACPNGSGMLFTSAKITHLANLPQGQPERRLRVKAMVAAHDENGFGGCQNVGECASVCPKLIPLESIGQLNRDLFASLLRGDGKAIAGS